MHVFIQLFGAHNVDIVNATLNAHCCQIVVVCCHGDFVPFFVSDTTLGSSGGVSEPQMGPGVMPSHVCWG